LRAAGCSSRNVYRGEGNRRAADRRELNTMLGKPAAGDVVTVTRICWICKAEEATTREHRNKRSDLKAVLGEGGRLISTLTSDAIAKFRASIRSWSNSARQWVIRATAPEHSHMIERGKYYRMRCETEILQSSRAI